METRLRNTMLAAAVAAGFLFTPLLGHAAGYIGAGFGKTNTELDVGPSDLDLDIDDSDSAFKVFGGFNVSPTFAVEFGYADLGEYSFTTDPTIPLTLTTTKVEATALYVSLIGRALVAPGWHVFGRLGLASWDVDLKFSEDGFSSSGTKSGLDPVVGVGFQYAVNRNVALRAEWEQFQNVGEDARTSQGAPDFVRLNGSDINVLSVGLSFQF